MAVRNGDKPGVVISQIIAIGEKKRPVRGKAPVSEPPAGDKEKQERLIEGIRLLLADASVTVSYEGGFDLKEFLDGIKFAKDSRQDEGIIVISAGNYYKFYIADITSKDQVVSVKKDQRIRLEEGDNVYYLFPVSWA